MRAVRADLARFNWPERAFAASNGSASLLTLGAAVAAPVASAAAAVAAPVLLSGLAL